MPRLLYLYPEEWTGRRARELHTLQTCLSLADTGVETTLVAAGGMNLPMALAQLGRDKPLNFETHNLSRKLGPIKSVLFFRKNFNRWLSTQKKFDLAYAIHLKATPLLQKLGIPYWWEAHEIFAESPKPGSSRRQRIYNLEKSALTLAVGRIATSDALAEALRHLYFPKERSAFFHVLPHGGSGSSVELGFNPEGPLVYAGTLSDWKGLHLVAEAAAHCRIPLRIIGGTRKEWDKFRRRNLTPHAVSNIEWKERTAPALLPSLLAGCRAGVSPTLPETASGRYSLPMKIFDYAQNGLPVIVSHLPSLRSLNCGSWCRIVDAPQVHAWTEILQQPFTAKEAADAMLWSTDRTWTRRGELLRQTLFSS